MAIRIRFGIGGKNIMSLYLSSRCTGISPSATLEINTRAKQLRAEGKHVYGFAVGEPDFPTPEYICDAAREALKLGLTRYTPVAGTKELRGAICEKLERDNGLHYKPGEVIVSNGAKQALLNAFVAILNPGDEVLLPTPCWVSYPEMVKLAEGTPVIVRAGIDQDFKITPAQLEAAITPKTRALILCSPSNPTGSVYSKEELAGLAAVLAKYPQVIVVADEIYEHINYIGKHQSIAQFAEIKDRVVIVNGVSKAYAMTGWRIGYLCAPAELLKMLTKMQRTFLSTFSAASCAATCWPRASYRRQRR